VTKDKELLQWPGDAYHRVGPRLPAPPFDKLRRQARWRARHTGAPVIRRRRPTDRRSRPQRWRDAMAELVALQSEYTQWFDALPEPLRETATGEALQAIVEFDLGELADLDPPRGFGRD
jgi:hypothetical protein